MAGNNRETRESGGTLILDSHVLPEDETYCDRDAVIDGGRQAYAGPTAELTRQGQRPLEAALTELYGTPVA